MFAVPIAFAVHQGWIRFDLVGFVLLVIASLTSNLAFLLAIRTRFNERFRDPTLVVPQMVVVAGACAPAATSSDVQAAQGT